MTKNAEPTIIFPSLWWIPLLSIIYSVIKICGGVDWSFATTIVIAPIMTYFGWCLGNCLILMFSILLLKMLNKREKQDTH